MTPKELFTRLQTEIKAMVWSATANKIFGDAVYVVTELPIQQIAQWSNISCFVVDPGKVNDTEHPHLMRQNFTITYFVENINDNFGQASLVGANRVANTSAGAGALDIEYELLRKLTDIIQMVTKAMIIEKSISRTIYVKNNMPLVTKSISCSKLVSVK